LFFNASCFSLSFIALEAMAMSHPPLVKEFMPTPEPPPLIDMSKDGLESIKSSAVFWATGKTVVEPSAVILLASALKDKDVKNKTAKATATNFRITLFISILLVEPKIWLFSSLAKRCCGSIRNES
jgi:hypothetical protein